MIAAAKPQRPQQMPQWRARFLAMLPVITSYAQTAFRDRNADTREDLVQEAVANCFVAYARLVERGKEHAAFASVLAMYAIRQIKDGRRVGNKTNVKDVYDQHAQVKNGHQLKHIGSPAEQHGGWKEQLVENRRTSPDELACFKIDFSDWWCKLSARDRCVAEDLAASERTGDVARNYGVSPSRVSQLRRKLEASWREFHDEHVPRA